MRSQSIATIRVSLQDDISDIILALKKTHARSVEVIFPTGCELLYHRINLVLLHRELQGLSKHKDIVFKSPETDLVDLMRQYHITAFSTTESSKILDTTTNTSIDDPFSEFFANESTKPQSITKELPRKITLPKTPPIKSTRTYRPPALSLYFYRSGQFWMIFITILVVFCAIAYILLPSATVMITEQGQKYTKDFEFIFDTEARDVDLENRTIPVIKNVFTESATQSLIPTGNRGGVPEVTESDLDLIKRSLTQELLTTLKQKASKPSDNTLKSLIVSDTISEPSYEGLPTPGSLGREFTIRATSSIQGLFYHHDDLDSALRTLLSPQIIDTKHLGQTMAIGFEDPRAGDNPNQIRARTYVEYQAIDTLDQRHMQRVLSAKSIHQARQYLEEFSSIQHADLTISPSFAPILPILPHKITIIIQS